MTNTTDKETITVKAIINAPVEKVWNLWTDPKHIIRWNHASDDWHTTKAENELKAGGKFLSRMESKDGNFGFDFTGIYEKVEPHRLIEYSIEDGRKVKIFFEAEGETTKVTESFEAELIHPAEMQRNGWQAILDNFKKHVETSTKFEIMQFEINIHASAEKIFSIMLNNVYWTAWTSAFNTTSTFHGSWEKGSKILFLGTDKNGSTRGMVSLIKEIIPNRLVRIEHVGVFHEGKELLNGKEAESWSGASENYTFSALKDKTRLFVDMDAPQEHVSYFSDTWPKALENLKTICEK